MKKIECVILDWAGTVVDYGCFAPVEAFTKAFKDKGLDVSEKEVRAPMGMTKIDHIRELFKLDSVSSQFKELFGREWSDADVKEMNTVFEGYLFASLTDFVEPIDGVLDIVSALRASGLKIGSTTGYTSAMMDIVAPAAKVKGYSPDCWFTSNGLPAGRPKPYMIYSNMIKLDVADVKSVVKVGDTVADILEGVNSGVWSVGIVLGSSELGLSQCAVDNDSEIKEKMDSVRETMLLAGADYVIDSINELPMVINVINNRLNK